MLARLNMNGIDQLKRTFGEMPLVCCRIDPDGEKHCSQVPCMRFIEANEVRVLCIGRADIVVVVEKPLGVSSWVSTTMAELWMALAGALSELS